MTSLGAGPWVLDRHPAARRAATQRNRRNTIEFSKLAAPLVIGKGQFAELLSTCRSAPSDRGFVLDLFLLVAEG